MYCAPSPSLRQHMVSVGSRTESTGQRRCGALERETHTLQPPHLRNAHLIAHGCEYVRHHLVHCGALCILARRVLF